MDPDLWVADTAGLAEPRRLAAGMDVGPNSGFSERRDVRFSVSGTRRWELRVDDESLVPELDPHGTHWSWSPNFFAGTVVAELREAGATSGQRFLLDVSPDPRKLGQAEFRTMLDELLALRPDALLGHEPATVHAGGRTLASHGSLDYAVLDQNAQQLFVALTAICGRPRTRLVESRRRVPLAGMRRADLRTLLVMSRGGSAGAARSADVDAVSTQEQFPASFDVPHSTVSLDAPATRCIVSMLKALIAHCERVVDELARIAAREESELATSLKARLGPRTARVRSIVSRLREILDAEPFCEVRKAEVTAAGLTAVSADPVYARARQLLWRMSRPGVGASDLQRTYMSPTWEIYERWCSLNLLAALRKIFPECGWSSTKLDGCDEAWVGTAHGVRVELRWQQTAPAWDVWRSGHRSVSKELRPDFVLMTETSVARRWWVFDAKYSQSRGSVLQAMQAAHVYHDALRSEGSAPSGSFLLVPALDASLGHLRDREHRAEHGVGVLVCAPAMEVRREFILELRSVIFGTVS